jgi:twitching motility protein PilT
MPAFLHFDRFSALVHNAFRDTGGVPGYDSELSQIVAKLNSAVPDTHDPQRGVPVNLSSLDTLLADAVRRGASDLLLIAEVPATLRIAGVLAQSASAPLTAEDTRGLLLPLLDEAHVQELKRNKSVDLCFGRPDIGRFRANVHYQRGSLAGSVRLLPETVPTLASLHLPAGLRRLAEARQGLVLVTGPTGCGKSSTLAALVDEINNHRADHVVTIEDPIEFVHANRKSIVEQIEVGRDAPDFANSLRSILRQNPNVILVGEMRDFETMATVLTAAETGHLVFSTLHTNDASQTISRILDSFPTSNQPQIRQQLSLALLAVVAQQLVPGLDGARYPAVEILIASSGVCGLVRKGDDHQLYSAISTGRNDGMVSMEQSLAEMVRGGRISRDIALAHCFRRDDLMRYLHG